MPSKSKAQQRFFGMVDAYKKGEMKNASSKIKRAANGNVYTDFDAYVAYDVYNELYENKIIENKPIFLTNNKWR